MVSSKSTLAVSLTAGVHACFMLAVLEEWSLLGIRRRCQPRTTFKGLAASRLHVASCMGLAGEVDAIRTVDDDEATNMESRIGGNLRQSLVREAYEKMQGVPVIAFEEELARRLNPVVDVLNYDVRDPSVVWQCLHEWLEVRFQDVRSDCWIVTEP